MSFNSVPSLASLSITSLVLKLDYYIDEIQRFPPVIREKILNLMSKRGLITDLNISKVVSDRIRVLDFSESIVSDRGLKGLGVCRNLRKLDLNSVKGSRPEITSEGIAAVAVCCPLLHTVYLRRCSALTDRAVEALSQSCRGLTSLNIGGCPLLTDISLGALAANSTRLSSLNFSHTQVSDHGVFRLASGVCQHCLAEIHMDNCPQLTDEAVEALLQFCPKMTVLLFHSCPLITDRARQALEELRGSGSASHRMKHVTWTIY